VLTREAAAVCLGRLGTNAAPAASALARALSDREGAVRIYAVASLSHIGKAAVPSLVRVISGKDGPARMAAIEALGRMRLEAVESIPVLLEALDDPEPGVRAAASFSLGLIGAPAIPGLVAVILQGKPPPRDSALASLRSMTRPIELRVFRTADEATIRALVSLFHAPWPEARLVAVQVLDRIPTKARAAEAELRKLLDDPDEAVREAARALVERMGPGKRGEGNW
jgi:HEAT repeat protein